MERYRNVVLSVGIGAVALISTSAPGQSALFNEQAAAFGVADALVQQCGVADQTRAPAAPPVLLLVAQASQGQGNTAAGTPGRPSAVPPGEPTTLPPGSTVPPGPPPGAGGGPPPWAGGPPPWAGGPPPEVPPVSPRRPLP